MAMKFNSQSVTLNRGVNYRYPVQTPQSFTRYKFAPDVIQTAIKDFNKKLDKRPHVTMKLGDIKADVLRLVPTSDDTLAIWLVVKEKDVDTLHEMCFTITGDVYFADEAEVNVMHMVINDVLYDDDDKGIFKKG
jgi:hypothetical protein